MAYNGNLSARNAKTKEEKYMYRNQENTILNNYSNLKEYKIKFFNIEKNTNEDKLKINKKNISNKTSNDKKKKMNSINYIEDNDHITDKSQKILVNNENKYNLNNFLNFKTSNFASNGFNTSRALNRNSTLKKDTNNVKVKMLKNNNDRIKMINEYRNINENNIKMNNAYNENNNLIYINVNNEYRYENVNTHDKYLLNFNYATINNSRNHADKEDTHNLKPNKLSKLSKIYNNKLKINDNIDNNFKENVSDKNYHKCELNKSHVYKYNSSNRICNNNVNANSLNNSTSESVLNKSNQNMINDHDFHYNNDYIYIPNENRKVLPYYNFTYDNNILHGEKEHQNINYDIYKNSATSFIVNNNENAQRKIINSGLHNFNYKNMENEINFCKDNTEELKMKLKLKNNDRFKYLSQYETIKEIEFLKKKGEYKDNNNYLNNKYSPFLYHNENVNMINKSYTDNILKEKIKKKNENDLTMSKVVTDKKNEDILNFSKNLKNDICSNYSTALKDNNDPIHSLFYDNINYLINKNNINSDLDNTNTIYKYNNSDHKKDLKNNIVESSLYNEEYFFKYNDINNNINENEKKILYITTNRDKNSHLSEQINQNNLVKSENNDNYYINIKMNKQKCIDPCANIHNKYENIDIFKNKNEQFLNDSSNIPLKENNANDYISGLNLITNKEISNSNGINYYNYIKESTNLCKQNNNFAKKININNFSDKKFKENNIEEKILTSSGSSAHLSLSGNNLIKINKEEFIKFNNLNEKNLNNLNEINYRNHNENNYHKIDNITNDDRKYNESNDYVFNEDNYLKRENSIICDINDNQNDNYYTLNKISHAEKSKSDNFNANNYILNSPLHIYKDIKSENYNNKKENLVDNNKKINITLHKNNTINNFIKEIKNEECKNYINTNTINIPLKRNDVINDKLNKNIMKENNINNNILRNKMFNNNKISHIGMINKSVPNNNALNNNKILLNNCELNKTINNNNYALNNNNIGTINSNNNFPNNNILNKDMHNTFYILSSRMITNNTVMQNNKINNNILYNDQKNILKVQKNKNENFLSRTILLNLDSMKKKFKKKELEECKSINNSEVYNYLRNINTKNMTKFYRTASLRNPRMKKKETVAATQEHINNFKEHIYEIDTKYIVKKAVVIGCNYINDGEARLYGCVNDAYVFCKALVKYFDFSFENILLLTDSLPSDSYIHEDFDINRKKYIKEENFWGNDNKNMEKTNIFNLFNRNGIYNQNRKYADINSYNSCNNMDIKNVDISSESINKNLWPTRINILKAVNWLVRDSSPFGTYVFYFAGKSVQVDNMSGWEGEGYDEAFLCSDPFNKYSEHNLITAVQLKDLLLSINSSSQMTIILDCSGGQTILDPAGTDNSWSYIKGCKQKGIWPIANPTNKVHKAIYDISILNNYSMKKYYCKARFSELIEVESTAAMIDPLLQSISSLPIAPKAYCLCAATWEQISIEGFFPIIEFARVTQLKKIDGSDNEKNNKNIRKKKKDNKETLSDTQKLNKTKNFYEKNFNISINMIKMLFNNNRHDANKSKKNNKDEDNSNSKKIYAHNSNQNNLKGFIYNDSNSNSDTNSDISVGSSNNDNREVDNYVLVSHGVFTYCFIEAIMEFKEKELKNNIFEKSNQKYLPMTLKNLVNLIQQKIQNIKNNKLKKLNQKPEFTIHPGANASIDNYFVHYSKNIHFQNDRFNFLNSDLYPFLNVIKAWEEINKSTLRQKKSLSLSSTIINSTSKYFT